MDLSEGRENANKHSLTCLNTASIFWWPFLIGLRSFSTIIVPSRRLRAHAMERIRIYQKQYPPFSGGLLSSPHSTFATPWKTQAEMRQKKLAEIEARAAAGLGAPEPTPEEVSTTTTCPDCAINAILKATNAFITPPGPLHDTIIVVVPYASTCMFYESPRIFNPKPIVTYGESNPTCV